MKAKAIPSHGQTHGPLEDGRVPIRLKLSALWATVMFLYAYVDIFTFYKPGIIDDILAGQVWEFDITQGWVVGGLVLMTIPALMVFLSLALTAGLARWANIVVGSLYIPVSLFNTIDETWSYFYVGAAVEFALLALVVWYAWSWPRVAELRTPATEARVVTAQPR